MDLKDNQEDSESIGSDESEEESELDEEESEKRRAECVADMKELEMQFSKLKDELIKEKFALIDKKLLEIENETAKEYTIPLSKFKENMEMKISIASSMREYRLKNIENTKICEEETAKQSLDHDKTLLFDNMKAKLEADIRQIEESRRLLYLEMKRHELYENENENNNTNNNIGNSNSSNSSNQINNLKRKLNKKSANDENERRKKTISVTGPYVVYSLSDLDILEDWLAIKNYVDTDNNNNNDDLQFIEQKNK